MLKSWIQTLRSSNEAAAASDVGKLTGVFDMMSRMYDIERYVSSIFDIAHE
jgi:hypothetical protein